MSKRNPFCYFVCRDCGNCCQAPTSDVKEVGAPMCPECDEVMPEVTKKAYYKALPKRPMTDIELVELLAEGLEQVGDVRVKKITVDGDGGDSEAVIELHNGMHYVLCSDAIRMLDPED